MLAGCPELVTRVHRRGSRVLFCFAIVAVVTFTPALASAHHVVSDYGIAWVEPRGVVEADGQAAAFDFDGRAGTWQQVSTSVEHAFSGRLSAAVRVPMARIRFADGHTVEGLGDLAITGKVRLLSTRHGKRIVSAGVGAEAPTGDADRGLGSGHWELAPVLAFSSAHAHDRLVIFAILTDRIELGEDEAHAHPDGGQGTEAHAHGSVLAPHGPHELSSRFGAAYVRDRAYVSGGMDLTFAVGDPELDGPAVARMEVGTLAGRRLRLAAGVETTVAGQRRFEWRARLGIAWILPAR